MKTLRLLFRFTRLAAVTTLAFAALELGFLLALPFADRVRRRRLWRRRVKQAWARAVCRALVVEIEVVGEPPRDPCLLVSNHLSYLDIPVYSSLMHTVFVSKSEVADWPVLGFLATLAGTIYVDRGHKRSLPQVNRRIGAALNAGEGVVVFPEGTSTGGDAVLPFRPSLLAPAAELELPVRYASLSYTTDPEDPPASEVVCWWRDMEFGPHVLGLMKLSRVRARVVFGPGAVRGADRKELAQTLWQSVSVGITRQP